MKPKTKTVLVVCTEANDELETRLVRAGWAVAWVYEAKSAIARVRRERFDLAVLISTGREMDVTETFLNLRDIRDAMAIVVIQPADTETPISKASRLSPQANVSIVENIEDLVPLLLINSKVAETDQPISNRPQP